MHANTLKHMPTQEREGNYIRSPTKDYNIHEADLVCPACLCVNDKKGGGKREGGREGGREREREGGGEREREGGGEGGGGGGGGGVCVCICVYGGGCVTFLCTCMHACMCVFSHMRVYVCIPGCTCTLKSVGHPPPRPPPPLPDQLRDMQARNITLSPAMQMEKRGHGGGGGGGGGGRGGGHAAGASPTEPGRFLGEVCVCLFVCVCTYACGTQGHTHIRMLQEEEKEEEDSYSMIDPKLTSPIYKEIVVVIWQNIMIFSPTSCVHWFRFGRFDSVR
jgi:hypothetical protein